LGLLNLPLLPHPYRWSAGIESSVKYNSI